MPQSSDEMRALMTDWFGSMDDNGPITFLLSKGWTEVSNGLWRPPTPSYFHDYDWYCLRYLVEEWDHDFDRQYVVPLSLLDKYRPVEQQT